MRGSRRLRRVPLEEVGLQIAPMIDVTLLLLFFFMLSGRLSEEAGRSDVKLPVVSVDSNPLNPSTMEVVNLNKLGEICVGTQKLHHREWLANLRRKIALHPKLKVLIRADADTAASKIRALLQSASEAGVCEVVYAVSPR